MLNVDADICRIDNECTGIDLACEALKKNLNQKFKNKN